MSLRTRLALVLTLATLPAAARAETLGLANDFNVFVLHDMTQSGTDSEGRVAVAHDATLTSYSVASSIGTGSTTTNLLVGHTWTQSSGGTVNGAALVNGDAFTNSPTVSSALHVNGNLSNTGGGSSPPGGTTFGLSYTGPSYFNPTQSTTPLPFDFSTAATYLTSRSAAWGSLAPTGTTTPSGGTVTLTGTNSALNVFSVPASLLTPGIALTISAPANSTALINITGGPSVSLSSFGITLAGGLDPEHTLYNLPSATSLTLSSVGLRGSLLAPSASVQFTSGNIDGTLVAYNLTGQGESHLHLFQGNLSTPVPTPAAATGSLALLTLLAARKLRSL